LTNTCKEWLPLPIASITRQQTRDLLEGFRQEGFPRKAKLTLSWLKALWRFCYAEEIVTDPIMDRVSFEHVKTIRDRVFSDDELASIWKATEKLSDQERDYVRLLLLLAPRKNALAGVTRSELNTDLSLWTTPTERVKQKRTAKARNYLTPLPPLAASIFERRLEAIQFDVLFPCRSPTKAFYPGTSLQGRVQKFSGVKDWAYHAHRHTIATWFQNRGHSIHDIGLLLNHSASGVTAGYSHGYPLELKLSLLQTWSDHVEELTA
jgi:integrase